MKKILLAVAAAASAALFALGGEAELTDAQRAVQLAGSAKLRLMIANFGTIESHTQVDKWLSEQIQETRNLPAAPTLTEGEKAADPGLQRTIVRWNWVTRRCQYEADAERLRCQNERDRQLLTALRMKVLTDSATRYVPLAKDYLQAALTEKCPLIQVVDRSNADMSLVEQGLNGQNNSVLAGATCILTAALGDREEDSRTITVNGRGTQVRMTVYTQPWVCKVRDLEGNVLCAFKGASSWSSKVNSVVKSDVADPERKLVEAACADIAGELLRFFTAKLTFKVKAPAGVDADEAAISLDGRSVDADDSVRVLAIEHALVATLDGCAPIGKTVQIANGEEAKCIVLKFRKAAEETAGEVKGVDE